MSQVHYYEVNVQWNEGRKGTLSSPVLNKTIECATPPEFPNGMPDIWSPEHLYAAAINSCYMATFLAVAENFNLPFRDFSCKTICKLEIIEGKYQITEAEIKPAVTLQNPETDRDKAIKVLEKSKAACLVTNSMKTAVNLHINFNH
ncbi:OsmC family protein [Fluviicola sp.]|jgi:organic hydroperoxide reductase OsmC/OhrA|uniref:OsmC family protein n=1 Tax=Fluviicola sp. TaxID=1917219 RepID=UPI0028179E2C|nr:OsmC family protein [Fluviicola sp.]MDR0801146.1 OsmC family protein [Fluviicola sp.]